MHQSMQNLCEMGPYTRYENGPICLIENVCNILKFNEGFEC